MLTGTTSCTIGSTNAPPFMTTFWPPRPVRTNARSFEDRRYSQLSSQTHDRDDRRDHDQAENELTELGSAHDAPRLIRLNFLVVSVIACSVGRRSMLEAP